MQRGQVLLEIARRLREAAAELARLETENMGKPIFESEFDVADAATCFEYYGGLATKITGDVNPVPDEALSLTLKEPVGVCGQIIPWNYPLLMAAWKIAPALCAGCTVVLKPAEATPLTAIDAGAHPRRHRRPAQGRGQHRHRRRARWWARRWPRASAWTRWRFTGSTRTGRSILRAAADSNLKRVTLGAGRQVAQHLLRRRRLGDRRSRARCSACS